MDLKSKHTALLAPRNQQQSLIHARWEWFGIISICNLPIKWSSRPDLTTSLGMPCPSEHSQTFAFRCTGSAPKDRWCGKIFNQSRKQLPVEHFISSWHFIVSPPSFVSKKGGSDDMVLRDVSKWNQTVSAVGSYWRTAHHGDVLQMWGTRRNYPRRRAPWPRLMQKLSRMRGNDQQRPVTTKHDQIWYDEHRYCSDILV